MNPDDSNALCLECGLCCNGVIFADVRLQPGDDVERLESLGLALRPLSANPQSAIRPPKFAQPCSALDGCRCRIYGDRPKYCREFDCQLLKRVKDDEASETAARKIIRSARQRVDEVKRLLGELGDAEEQLPLSKRFRRMQQRLERNSRDKAAAHLFSELSLAMHELNVLLSEAFYPGVK